MASLNSFFQLKVLLSRWGIVGRRLKVIIFAFLCSIVFCFMYMSMYLIWPQWRDEVELKKYSSLYCNNEGVVTGKEGSLPFVIQRRHHYNLLQVNLVIRHGDRAPIVLDTLPNTKPVEISCLFNKSRDDLTDREMFKKHASVFKVIGSPSTSASKTAIIEERDVCNGGQLTPTGFMQHILNGKHLNRMYTDFLNTIDKESDVFLTTTNYGRTVQSCAALLYGLFSKNFFKRKFNIQVSNDKYPETHFLTNEKGEAINCPILIQRLRDVWQTNSLVQLRKLTNPIKKNLAKLLDADRDQIASLDRIVDIFYTKLCHFQKLPEGPNGEVSFNLASYSFELAHKLITLKHTPIAELQTLAILSKIVSESAKFVDETLRRKLIIFSGHDTVVSPFLSMLGANDEKWPPYASRVVIEFWQRSPSPTKSPDSYDIYSKFDDYFYRILYNGKPLTAEVRFCKDKIVDLELCPFSEFVKYVSGSEFGGQNFFQRIENLCAVQ